jgi:hypothetical protein
MAYIACFEKLSMVVSRLVGFHDVGGRNEGIEHNQHSLR